MPSKHVAREHHQVWFNTEDKVIHLCHRHGIELGRMTEVEVSHLQYGERVIETKRQLESR